VSLEQQGTSMTISQAVVTDPPVAPDDDDGDGDDDI